MRSGISKIRRFTRDVNGKKPNRDRQAVTSRTHSRVPRSHSCERLEDWFGNLVFA
jgi:hypothetical protein